MRPSHWFTSRLRTRRPTPKREFECFGKSLRVEPLESRLLMALMPNIIVINTDDQRFDSLPYMPTVQSQLMPLSANFVNSFVPTPICAPSRASLLTGLYAHNHGVLHVLEPWGGFENFNDGSTLATWLDSAGYNTAMIGKYINGYDQGAYENRDPNDTYVPPGWDEWRAMLGASFNSPKFSVDGATQTFPGQYTTDVMSDMAEDFIRDNSNQDDTPFFMYFAPHNPHAPSVVADRHQGFYDDLEPYRPPSFNEADVSDKPQWVKNQLPLMTAAEIAALDQFRKDQLESLLSVDEGVAQMLEALRSTDQLQNTIIIYTSDNGQVWGEHRLVGKGPAWEESIRVPLLIYDGRNPTAATIDEMALNVDLAPTILQMAGVAPPQAMDGRSLTPLIDDQTTNWRNEFLIENYLGDGGRFYGIRTDRYTYTEYVATSGVELYDNLNDPFQLVSQHNNPGYASVKTELAARLRQLKSSDLLGPVTSNLGHAAGAGGAMTLTATVSDFGRGGDEVRNAEFFVDVIGNTGTGDAMRAADGRYDSVTENMVVEITGLSPGPHKVFVHGRDLSGNWGPFVEIEVGGPPPSETALYRVNAGGPQLAGNPAWSADTAAAPSPLSNVTTGGNSAAGKSTAAINMTHPSIPAGTPMALFQDERYDRAGVPNLLWDFPVTPGQYEVRLYFAETNAGTSVIGGRVFDVMIEGATVLDNYDIFADVGKMKGVVKRFVVNSDSNLDVDFLRGKQNPTVTAIEIVRAGQQQTSPLNVSAGSLDFGAVNVGQTATRQITLTNGGATGHSSITIDPSQAAITPAGSPYTVSFAQSTPIVLAPGQSAMATVAFTPTSGGPRNAALAIPHNGANSPLSVSITGSGLVQASVVYRINAGGPQIAGSPAWSADTSVSPSPYSNVTSGGNSAPGVSAATINMSHPSIPIGTPMSLFQTERFDKPAGANLLWDFPVAPGQYEVRLYFAETFNKAYVIGGRVFDVVIEGATALDNYDIFADVGKLKGVVKSFIVTSDSNLDIDFLRGNQNPTVTAIEILTVGDGSGLSMTSWFTSAASGTSVEDGELSAASRGAGAAGSDPPAWLWTAREVVFASLRNRPNLESKYNEWDVSFAKNDLGLATRRTQWTTGTNNAGEFDRLETHAAGERRFVETLDSAFATIVPREFVAAWR